MIHFKKQVVLPTFEKKKMMVSKTKTHTYTENTETQKRQTQTFYHQLLPRTHISLTFFQHQTDFKFLK